MSHGSQNSKPRDWGERGRVVVGEAPCWKVRSKLVKPCIPLKVQVLLLRLPGPAWSGPCQAVQPCHLPFFPLSTAPRAQWPPSGSSSTLESFPLANPCICSSLSLRCCCSCCLHPSLLASFHPARLGSGVTFLKESSTSLCIAFQPARRVSC